MPTYAYACKSCGHHFDAVQAFTDPTLTECPECSGALKKVFGSVGISFKGSGFYKTDSRKSTSSSSSSSSASGSSTPSSSESGSGASSSGSGDGGSKGGDKGGDKAAASTSGGD